MDKQYLLELLQKYRDGNLSNEEEKFLLEYYDLFGEEPGIEEVLKTEEIEITKHEIKNAINANILELNRGKIKSGYFNWYFVKFAAAAIILFIIGGGTFYLIKDSVRQIQPVTSSLQKENRIIILPDGSKVILSPGSKLNYPSTFEGLGKREVFLIGQAYFDIEHSTSMPFVVHAGGLETVVLGTAFNIKAFAGESNVEVTVTRGKVKVIDTNHNKILGILTSNQQISYSPESSRMQIVNSESVLKWQDNDLFCDNLTLGEVAELLEEQFKVKIIISHDSIRSQRFTTTFSKREKLENILESICLFNDLDYRFNQQDSTFYLEKN